MNLWLQVFDVCDVSDHDGSDELCDSPQRLPENSKHSHNDGQSPKGEPVAQPNHFYLNVISIKKR